MTENKLTDSEMREFTTWIKGERCMLCSPKSNPRGPSDMHHVGDRQGHRHSVQAGIPVCRHHHRLITDEPYLEEMLKLREWGQFYLIMWTKTRAIDHAINYAQRFGESDSSVLPSGT